MTRGLTLPTATEAARRNGAFPVHVLEIEWHDGIRLYSDGATASLPVAAEARVKDWGSLVIESTPEQLGGYSDLTITMFDTDRVLMDLAKNNPGFPGAKAKLYLWFVGTDWSDRLTLFGGHVMQPSSYDFKDGTWKLKLAGYEKQYQKHLGLTITRQRFADVICESCDGKLIPIVFGDPCLRVPCCVIDRPGRSWLAAPLGLHDQYMYIQGNPVNPDPTQTDPLYNPYGFTNDATITIEVGPAGNTETITGCFCTPSDRTKFTIYSRSSIQASGTSPGVLGADGHYHFLINAADISDPSFGRGGYIIYLNLGGTWQGFIIGEWITSGSSIAVLDVTNLYPLAAGVQWKISAQPSEYIPYWPVGTDVFEDGDWTYVANFLPSQWVDRIEALAKLTPPNGGNPQDTWYTYSSAYYSVNRDNRAYNTALGRDMGSPGITTLTLSASPQVLGFDDETVYATVRGITTGLFGGDTCANPAKIIKTLLTHPQLGNVPPDEIDSYSFACAETATLSQRMAFAITTPAKLFEICAQLAFQAGLLHFWDCGKAYLSPVDTVPDASKSVLTIDVSSTQRGSLQISDPGETDKATELAGTYRLTCAAEQSTLVRQSLQQVDMFGRQRREIDFWGFQNNRFVALQTEFWLATLLSQQRQITVTTYLNALHVQPGDVVKFNQVDGDGNALLSNVPARVQQVSHKFLATSKGTMETIELKAVANLWPVEAEVAAVDLDACNPPAGDVQIVKNDMDHIKPTPNGPTTTTSSTTSTTTTLPCLCVGTAETITINLPNDITKTSLYGGGVALAAGNYTFIKNTFLPNTTAPYRCWWLWSNGPIDTSGGSPWTTGTQYAHCSFDPGSLGNQRPEVTWQTTGGSVYYGGFGTYVEGDCGSLPKQGADSGIASAPSYVTLSY